MWVAIGVMLKRVGMQIYIRQQEHLKLLKMPRSIV